MGLARFTEQAFVGEVGGSNTIRSGKIGEIYGMPVHVTPNADFTYTAEDGLSGAQTNRVVLIGHRDSAVMVKQLDVRSQTQYKQEYLGTLFTADTLYGVKELRDGSCFALAVPA